MKSFCLGTGPDGQLQLPIDIVTQTIGIVAKKRTGKSYLARKLTEGLLQMQQQVCVVDPKGDWWGLRSAADGKNKGYPVLIIGGERGDIPLEPSSGEVVAQLVAEEPVPVILDLSLLRKHEVATFMASFLETLYRLKAKEALRTPLMLIVDEADAIAPQQPQPNEARMLGAMEDIVRRGGQRGIGCTMITQRTAVLNKNVLTQCQILIALRTISPQDLKAMNAWVDVHGEPKQREQLMATLPSLPVGDSWVWSPGWPTEKGIFTRIHTAPITTFDSGATPKAGEKRTEPRSVATIDLTKLKAHMATAIEEARANDPKELKAIIRRNEARIRELEKLTTKPTGTHTDAELDEILQKALVTAHANGEKRVNEAREAIATMIDVGSKYFGGTPVTSMASMFSTGMRKAQSDLTVALSKLRKGPRAAGEQAQELPRNTAIDRRDTRPTTNGTGKDISGPERKILTVLAQHSGHQQAVHDRCLTIPNKCVAIRAGYSYSGGFRNYLSALRGKGLIESVTGGFTITKEGITALGSFESLPTGNDLLIWWKARVSGPEAKILDVLSRSSGLDGPEVAAASGYEYSGGFRNYISSLRTKGLIEGRGRDKIRLHEDLT